MLPPVADWPAPDLRFDEASSAQEIDATLRKLADLYSRWDAIIGFCAGALREARIHELLGFATFRQYAEERLGLPARTVEQRAALEKRLQSSKALQEARRQKVPYEKLRVLARLPEADIGSWTSRAQALTVIELRRRVEGEKERQMRARRRMSVPLPRRIAVLLAAAIQVVRGRTGRFLPPGKCLAVIAQHFIDTWEGAVGRSRSRSQKVRARDEGHCTVPGCSRRATHSHHVEFRSQGGGDEAENQTAACGWHHLDCIHGGHLTVTGRAPDALTWMVSGRPFTGR
jgi:hypothetical protein